MNAEMFSIDDLCAGLEEATKADEIAKTDEKIKSFVNKIQEVFENTYIYYKTSINLNARSPHTKTFKDWMRMHKNLRNDLPQPFLDWCRSGLTPYFDEQTKEIYFVAHMRDPFINISRLEIRTRTWAYRDLDRQPAQTGVSDD